MNKINEHFLKWLSSNRLSERTKLLLLLFAFFIIGVISFSAICLLLYWLKWKSIIVIIVYIFIFLTLTFIKNKYRNNFWQFLSFIISLPKYLIYFIYPTFIIIISYLLMIIFSFVPSLIFILIINNVFRINFLNETIVFISFSLFSIISVYGQKTIRWAIRKYSPLKNKGEYIFELYQEELALYVIDRSNLIFLIYLIYLLYLSISNFIQIQYHSPLISTEIDNAILKSFIVFIAFSNMVAKSKEAKIDPKELFTKIIKLFIKGKQPPKDVVNNDEK